MRAARILRSVGGAKVGDGLVTPHGSRPIGQKYTLQSHGIWERIRRLLAVDPNRSNGVPLNPQFRNPPPGANDPAGYTDPVTLPAGDIADNQYYNRDARRAYPQLSTVKQGDVVALLSVGSKASPKEDILQIGEAGTKQLAVLSQEGEEKGLAAAFEKDNTAIQGVLGAGGLPPFPAGFNRGSVSGTRDYLLDEKRENGFPEEYPCRTFT